MDLWGKDPYNKDDPPQFTRGQLLYADELREHDDLEVALRMGTLQVVAGTESPTAPAATDEPGQKAEVTSPPATRLAVQSGPLAGPKTATVPAPATKASAIADIVEAKVLPPGSNTKTAGGKSG